MDLETRVNCLHILVTPPLNLLMNGQVDYASVTGHGVSTTMECVKADNTNSIPSPTLLTLTKLILLDSRKVEAPTYCLESHFSELKVRRNRGDASLRFCPCK
jgi:hypothetical protein